jgi:predicted GNAT family acetyltransferase
MEIREENSRFALYDGDKEIGEMTWFEEKSPVLFIDHTFVDPTYRGQGLANQLVKAGVEKARAEGKTIKPICSFVKREFDRVAEYADVLAK